MTCIVAMVDEGIIHMAGDKLGSNGYTKLIVNKPKIFINGSFIVGYTTSFRMGQLLEYTWNPPEKLESQTVDYYIYKVVVDSIKTVLKDDGFATDTQGGNFLLGYNGRLFEIQDDYSVFEVTGYSAVGCGEQEAKAVLYTLYKVKADMSKEAMLSLAIEASSITKTGVSSSYDYITL